MREAKKYLKIIRRWWWVTFLVVGATVGSLLALIYVEEPEYEASVTVQVSAPPPQEVPLFSDFGREAVSEQIEQTRNGLAAFLQEGNTSFEALESVPDVAMNPEELQNNITVELPRSSQLVYVRVRARDPETASVLANAVVEVGLRLYGELLAKPTANTREFVERQLEMARAELTEAETALTQFQINNKVGSLDKAIDDQSNLIRALRQNRDLTQASGDSAKAQALDQISLEREIELQNMIGLLAEYNDLVDRVERARAYTNLLQDKRNEAEIKENQILEMGSIQVVNPARPPRNPVLVISLELIILSAVVSILVGILLSFLLEYWDTSALRNAQRYAERPDIDMRHVPDPGR
jgi:uncharacterized protein involved in exopolysaccharide biosynthesis